MANNIPEYFAPNSDINPSSTGASSWEQTGRRLAPLYNEAAQFQTREGKLAAEAEKQKMWPFDILRLYQIRATQAAKNAPGQGGFQVKGGGGNASDLSAPIEHPGDGWSPGFNDLGQVSRGAAALGNAMSDGGYSAAGTPRARSGAPAPDNSSLPAGPEYTLYQGQFITMGDQRKIDAQARGDQATYMNDYGSKLSDYYQQYYGYQSNGQAPEGTGPVSNMNPNNPSVNYNPPASTGYWSGVSDFIDHSATTGGSSDDYSGSF